MTLDCVVGRPNDADDVDSGDRTAPARGRWSRATAEVALPGLASTAAPGEASAFDPPRERFAIGDELGRGGMGRVLAATDVALLRPVAIKQVLRGGRDDHARFEREVRITAVAIFGGVEVFVDDSIDVRVRGVGVLGGFERPRDLPPAQPGAPVVVIDGLALMGGVEVKRRTSRQLPAK